MAYAGFAARRMDALVAISEKSPGTIVRRIPASFHMTAAYDANDALKAGTAGPWSLRTPRVTARRAILRRCSKDRRPLERGRIGLRSAQGRSLEADRTRPNLNHLPTLRGTF
jgi:hypothetical protein